MIQLDQYEKQWILLIKGQLKDKYPFTGSWCKTLKPLFIEIYGWNPDEDNNYKDYLQCMFNSLLDIHMKIRENWSSENAQLKELFEATFCKSFFHEEESPIERGISKLCGLIQCTTVVDKDGNKRFDFGLIEKNKMENKLIKLTNLQGEKILIGIGSIISTETIVDQIKKTTYTRIESRGCMVKVNIVTESVDEIYNLINN